MSDERLCPECGSPVPESGPADGLCPRCLLKQGLPGEGPTRTGGIGPGGFRPPTPAELAARFPQFEILELVGQGGMGAVYKARQPGLDRVVALKILAPDRVQDSAFAERFGREARTLARLSHPHIIAIHDFGETDGLYYFVMEYVDGANLREVMRAGQMSPADALAVVPQICEALQFAHDAGVVHRDIKPGNILVDRTGIVKIADFGLAKLLEPDRGDDVSLTGSGAVMGTPAYMAPEQIEHPLDVDHRADIYAVGVVFYEMLTGELPLGRFDPPSSKVRVNVQLDEVVLRALEKEPQRRYQFAQDVSADIERIDSGGDPLPLVAPPPADSRTITITRPAIVTWIATYSYVMAAILGVGSAITCMTLAGRLLGMRNGVWGGGGTWAAQGSLAALAVMTGVSVFVVLAIWHLIAATGALKLRNWSRYNLIVLALIELPAPALLVLTPFLFLFVLSTIGSVLVIVYLFRRPVARIFELGLGTVTLPAAEADALEPLMARGPWA